MTRRSAQGADRAVRRARPLLGTVVEVGACGDARQAERAATAALAEIARLQGLLSRFEADSDIARFNALDEGGSVDVQADTAAVLDAAARLERLSEGRFDISQGHTGRSWQLSEHRLRKCVQGVTLDLGGIAKGYAVDAAIAVLHDHGCTAGWVNAGGDLRTYGPAPLTLQLRDEAHGGVRAWGRLQDGACATSRYGPGSRSRLAGGEGLARHLSVLAPCCLWADALTKVAALDRDHPALAALGARAYWH